MSRSTSDDSVSPTAPAAACSSTGAPPRRSPSSARPTPTRWAWPAAVGTAGPEAGSPTTGTRCSRRTGSSGHAALDDQSAFIASLGSSRSDRMRDVLVAPSSPTRTPSSARARAARSSSTVARAPGRRSSRSTARRTCSTPTRGSARAGAASSSSVRTSPTSPTSPTSCPASARRVSRPAPCATSSPRVRSSGRDRPGGRPAEGLGRHGGRDRAGGPVVRGAAHRGDGGLDALGRRVGEPARLGRGVRVAGAGDAAQRGSRPGLGGAAHDPRGQARVRPRGPGRVGGDGPPGPRPERTSWATPSERRGR